MAAPFSLANLVHESAITTGTGNFTLAQLSGKQTFDQAFGHGATTDVFEHFISNQGANEWEHGSGHMSDATTLVRDTVWDSSNAGSAVSFSAGTKDVTSAIGSLALWCPRGYIDGMVLSNDAGTPNTKLDIAAGLCRDDTDAMSIRFTASRVIDCTTTGANGLDTGSPANTTWYYVFAIGKRDGSAQAGLASASSSSPTMPAGYQYKRRIGAFRTDGSAHILSFKQLGDTYLWNTMFTDANNVTPPDTNALLKSLTVPSLQVDALFRSIAVESSGNFSVIYTSPDESDQNPATAGVVPSLFVAANSTDGAGHFSVRTDTSGRIRLRSSTTTGSYYIGTYGWVDQRGKNS
jgi:hypothetical protein